MKIVLIQFCLGLTLKGECYSWYEVTSLTYWFLVEFNILCIPNKKCQIDVDRFCYVSCHTTKQRYLNALTHDIKIHIIIIDRYAWNVRRSDFNFIFCEHKFDHNIFEVYVTKISGVYLMYVFFYVFPKITNLNNSPTI